ncbi:MAG: hypothetical protein WCS72_19100 [Deltaproteobacteria bacterium]
MSLPASGPLWLSNIKGEFGGATPPQNLRAYLKGGGYVNTWDTAPNVPSSGTIKILDFLGSAKAAAFTASASPTGVYGSGVGPITANTGNVTVSPSGGSSPFTYAWTYVSGDVDISVASATSATTHFHRDISAFDVPQVWSAVWRCTVTDASSRTATVDVTVEVECFN